MARITKQGITGAIGSVVFYSVNGKNYVMSKRKKEQQKRRRGKGIDPKNEQFGIVSTYGSRMLGLLREHFLFHTGRDAYNRFRGWLKQAYTTRGTDPVWEISIENGTCPLSTGADLRDHLRVPVVVQDLGGSVIKVGIPPIDTVRQLKIPSRAVSMRIKALAVSAAFKPRPIIYAIEAQEVIFNLNQNILPAHAFTLALQAEPGDIAIVALALEFKLAGSELFVTDPKWLPAGVVAAGRLKG